MRKFFLAALSLILLFGWGLPVRAQGQAEADLYPVDASAFPVMSSLLDVFDASGRFVSGLKPSDATMLEDGQPLPVKELNESVIPAQIVVAINPGPSLGVRNTQGTQRFQQITDALNAWGKNLPSNTPDDLSLVTIAGPVIAHAGAKDWLVSLNAFQPDFRATTPNLQSLSVALDTAIAQTPRVGMKHAVLFITPHMDDPNIDTLIQPLIVKAQQNRVHVFVWFVDTDIYAATTSAATFSNLAEQTGGAYFSATSNSPLPDPESYFAPLRRLYTLKYNSAAGKGGQHTLSIQINSPSAGKIQSAEQNFSIDIQPPNPIFVQPPLQIVRQPPQNDPYNDKVLLPNSQKIDILIEFPDHHTRPLVRTTFYVDGQIMAENKSAPFDTFTWDLSGYKISGEHKILVEAVDSFGLSKTSLEIPVTVTVIQPPRGINAFFARYKQYITYGAIGFAGLALLLIVFFGSMRSIFARARASRQAAGDPLTQPVPAKVEPITGRMKRAATANGRAQQKTDAPAWFQRLTPDLQAAPVSPIPLTEKEITFGTDPVQSSYILDDPSLSPRHAKLTRTEDGNYLLADAGTIAGTWVNFEPVGKEGHLLRHNDVVHFGQLAFRFEMKNPPEIAEPKIIKEMPLS
jgi:hypothetical protein